MLNLLKLWRSTVKLLVQLLLLSIKDELFIGNYLNVSKLVPSNNIIKQTISTYIFTGILISIHGNPEE